MDIPRPRVSLEKKGRYCGYLLANWGYAVLRWLTSRLTRAQSSSQTTIRGIRVGNAKRFWALYQAACAQMPVWSWHTPQMAYACMLGHRDPGDIVTIKHPHVGEFRVKILDMVDIAPCPKELGYDKPCYALHFKGPKRRHLMAQYVSAGR